MIDFSDDDALAAEYVLGTLDASERTAVEGRRRREPAFEALVLGWETRLAPLAAAGPDLTPPPGLLAEILTHLPAREQPMAADNVVLLQRRVRTWRSVAAVASALAAVLALWVVGHDALAPPPPRQTFVAVLQHGADTPSFVVSVDLANRRMAVMPLSTTAPPDKSYELWMIGPDGAAPRSMGVIDAGASLHPHVPDVNNAVLSQATYAVTLEPHGGSPTGQPTSAPLFVGKLMPTSL